MISISTVEQNSSGNVLIKLPTDADIKDNKARVSRTSTLDGGVVINHLGISEGDRTFSINANLTKTQCDNMWDIFNDNRFVLVGTAEGIFYAAIQTLKIKDGEIKLTILINNKETT